MRSIQICIENQPIFNLGSTGFFQKCAFSLSGCFYPGKLTMRTADITTSKLHWNSVLSMQNAKYMCLDINFFTFLLPSTDTNICNLHLHFPHCGLLSSTNSRTRYRMVIFFGEMRCTVWGLPHAVILANKLLWKHLAPHGYFECKQTPGLWKHMSRPISFTLVIDDFGVKYEWKEDIEHLIKSIKQKYELTEDWDGDLYCSIHIKWDYIAHTLDISMPGFIIKKLQTYKCASPTKPQHCPHSPQPQQYGSKTQHS